MSENMMRDQNVIPSTLQERTSLRRTEVISGGFGYMSDSNHRDNETVWTCRKCPTKYQPHCRFIMKGETTNPPISCPFKPESAAEWKEVMIGGRFP